jgi:hypothetical protein
MLISSGIVIEWSSSSRYLLIKAVAPLLDLDIKYEKAATLTACDSLRINGVIFFERSIFDMEYKLRIASSWTAKDE